MSSPSANDHNEESHSIAAAASESLTGECTSISSLNNPSVSKSVEEESEPPAAAAASSVDFGESSSADVNFVVGDSSMATPTQDELPNPTEEEQNIQHELGRG